MAGGSLEVQCSRTTWPASSVLASGIEGTGFGALPDEYLCGYCYCYGYCCCRVHSRVLALSQAEYVSEGIDWRHIAYEDNQEVLELIEGRGGVLGILDEQGKLPRVRANQSMEKGSTRCRAGASCGGLEDDGGLIEGRRGVLSVLDEQGTWPRVRKKHKSAWGKSWKSACSIRARGWLFC